MEPIKLGIVGLGEIATRTHLPLWLKTSGQVRVVGLCDADTKKLEQASRFRVGGFYEDMDEMLEKEDIDLIDVCTPPNTHKDICLKALNAGVNCIVEKPMATSSEAADEIIKVARDRNLHLFAIHNCSFVPILRKAKDLVSSGEIGDILQVDVKLSISIAGELNNPSHWAHKLPGGLFGELAPHPCYALVEFLNGEIKEVKAQLVRRSPFPFLVGGELRVLAATANAIGSFSVSLNSPARRMAIDIIGSKLWVSVDAEAQVLVKYPPFSPNKAVFRRGKRALSNVLQRIGCLCDVSFNVATGRYKPMIEGHRYLFRQALRALRGQGTYPVSLDNVRKEVKILEAAFSQVNELYESSVVQTMETSRVVGKKGFVNIPTAELSSERTSELGWR